MKRGIALFLMLLLVMTAFVYAAGSSTGGSSSAGSSEKPKETPIEQPVPPIIEKPNCENNPTMQGRIQCRLINPEQEGSTPEPCRGLSDSVSCVKLYNDAEPCYTKSASDKSKCFKEVSGFSKGDKASVKNYVILLLYELQERVEEKYKGGKIDSYKASRIIERIVKIKQALLTGKQKSDIKSMLADLKVQWQSDMK